MNILKKLFLLNNQSEKNKDLSSGLVDKYVEKTLQLRNCHTFQKFLNE